MDATAELEQALKTAPPGTFRVYRGQGTGVEGSPNQAIQNLGEVQSHIGNALKSGCYLEVIDLRLQFVDFWLRYYYVNKAVPGAQRWREFGRLVEECAQLGLEHDLTNKLKKFNTDRKDAVHGFLVGRTSYNKLKTIVEESEPLMHDVALFVIEQCGTVITSLGTHHEGDIVINVTHARAALAKI